MAASSKVKCFHPSLAKTHWPKPGRFAAHQPTQRHKPDRDGHRPPGVLPLHRVGHHDRAGSQERKILSLLRRAVSGIHLKHRTT